MSKKAKPMWNYGLTAVKRKSPVSKETIREIAHKLGLNFSPSSIQEIEQSLALFNSREEFFKNMPRISNIRSELVELRTRAKAFAEILGHDFDGQPQELNAKTKTMLAKHMRDIWDVQERAMFDAARFFYAANDLLKVMPKDKGGRTSEWSRDRLIRDLADIYRKEFGKKGITYDPYSGGYSGDLLVLVQALLEHLNEIGLTVSMHGLATAVKNIK